MTSLLQFLKNPRFDHRIIIVYGIEKFLKKELEKVFIKQEYLPDRLSMYFYVTPEKMELNNFSVYTANPPQLIVNIANGNNSKGYDSTIKSALDYLYFEPVKDKMALVYVYSNLDCIKQWCLNKKDVLFLRQDAVSEQSISDLIDLKFKSKAESVKKAIVPIQDILKGDFDVIYQRIVAVCWCDGTIDEEIVANMIKINQKDVYLATVIKRDLYRFLKNMNRKNLFRFISVLSKIFNEENPQYVIQRYFRAVEHIATLKNVGIDQEKLDYLFVKTMQISEDTSQDVFMDTIYNTLVRML